MKYIITDNNDVIIHMSDTIDYQQNGNPLVDNGTLAIAKILVKAVCEVQDVPSEVTPMKYCYTEEQGFYANENYVEPVRELTNQELQEQITDLQLALAEIYEGSI